MKKADLNSKDPYEITHSMKPDTASEAKEMDKISAFMQEETGATLRNAITARESFYKNTKNPTPEQQEGLAALMKIQQKLGYGKPAEGPALNGQKKAVSYQEAQKGPLYGPAAEKPAGATESKPTAGKSASTSPKFKEGYSNMAAVLPRYSNKSIEMQKQSYETKLNEWQSDYDSAKKRGVSPAGLKKMEEQKTFMEGALKAVNEEIKARSAKDSAPRILTGDTRIKVRK